MVTEILYRSDMSVNLVESWGSDEMVARAARVSTNSDLLDQGKIKGLIGYLIRNRHMSPFAHVGATFRVESPLFVRDQMVRHKFLDPNIQSLRFSEASPEFYLPAPRSEEHTSELQSRGHLVCRLLLEKKKRQKEVTRSS